MTSLSWSSGADWDGALDEEGVVHESVANTDHDDASILKQGFAIQTPFRSADLVGYWPLQEGSGGTAYDFGSGNTDATYQGPTVGQTGLLGATAPSFDGIDDHVELGNYTPITSPPLTLIAWFNASSLPSTEGHTYKVAGDKDYEYEISINGSTDELRYRIRDGAGYNAIPGSVISANTWHMTALVYKSDGSVIGYLDATQDATATLDGTLNGDLGEWQMGIRGDGAPFKGEIADVRLYSAALSASEIQTVYDVVRTSGSLLTSKQVV